MDILEDTGLTLLYYATVYLLIAVPVSAPLAVWWSVRRELIRRRREAAGGNTTGVRDHAPVRFELRHLAHWMPVLLLGLVAASAIGLRFGWGPAIVPLTLSGYMAYRWQIALRRQRVAWPIVYALTLWVLPQLACTAMIGMFGTEFQWSGNPYSMPVWVWEVDYGQVMIQKTRLLVATAVLAAVALAAAIMLARTKRPPVSPNLVALVAFAHPFVFWFSNPFGFLLGTWSMVLIGHAISREARSTAFGLSDADEVESTGQDRQRVVRNTFAWCLIAATVATIAYGIYWMSAVYDESTRLEFDGIPIMLSWGLGVALIALTLWAVWRDKLREYGATICGLAWIPFSYMVYGFEGARTYQEYWLHAWSFWQIAALAIAATVMLVAMWRVFGPVAVGGDSRIHTSDDTRTVIS